MSLVDALQDLTGITVRNKTKKHVVSMEGRGEYSPVFSAMQ